MNESYCLAFDKIGSDQFMRVGGKCASLGDMTRAGVAVPPGFAVTTDAYREMLSHNALWDRFAPSLDALDADDIAATEAAASAIRASVVAAPVPEAVEHAIREAYSEMGGGAVAIRSSATAEDLPDASFAGQQDTYLWISGADNVVAKVRDCWASLYSARAIAYRAANDIPQNVEMAVAVQRMVNAKAAGVAMTLDPSNGDRTRIVIDASWGLGETVVSGTVTPDNFVVEKVMQEILTRTISDKHLEMVADEDAGQAVEREITDDRRTMPSLTDDEVIAVALLAKSLERQNKCPQDVEWAIDADLPAGANLVALQSRPETVWSQKKKAKTAPSFGMGLSGIASTLTAGLKTKT